MDSLASLARLQDACLYLRTLQCVAMERTQTALLGQQVLYSMAVHTALASGRMERALQVPGDSASLQQIFCAFGDSQDVTDLWHLCYATVSLQGGICRFPETAGAARNLWNSTVQSDRRYSGRTVALGVNIIAFRNLYFYNFLMEP